MLIVFWASFFTVFFVMNLSWQAFGEGFGVPLDETRAIIYFKAFLSLIFIYLNT